MLNSLPARMIRLTLSRLARFAAVALAVVAVLGAFAIILLRYWLLPGVEQYHDEISASVTEAIGSTVTIGKIEGDWEGFQPRLSLTDVRILDASRQPALILPRVDSSISWMSVLSAELRLSRLEINRPELLVRRDAQGKLFLGDVSLSGQGEGHNLADWLLHQSRMVVRDALIVWVDEQREAPPLVLQEVNLRIENLFDRHRFALRALPPEDLATPLDVRGDFYGASFDELSHWHGQIFTQIDFADVTAWRHWLELPSEFSRGRGALRAWLNVDAGNVAGVTADMELHNVLAKLAEDVQELELASLYGRAAWRAMAGGFEVSTRGLAAQFKDGTELQPMDLYFRRTEAMDGQPASGELRANLLQLETIAGMANYFPLEPDQRSRLEAYSPRGRVSQLRVQWQGATAKPDSFSIGGHFEDIVLRQVGAMPGFSGLSMDVDGSDSGGKLNINSSQLVVDAPGVMPEPLTFVTLAGQINWARENGETRFTVENMAVANDDAAGTVTASYLTRNGTRGDLDLTASLTRGNIKHASRYVPLIAMNRERNDWLKRALLAGHTSDFSIRIKGNLSDFPLDGTKEGVFMLGGHAQGAALEFAGEWPRIENITGEFSIRGNRLEVKSPSATMLGARLQNVVVTLPDMTSPDLALEINGEAVAENDTFLQFIQQSPVRGYISGLTDKMHASGNGYLGLFVRVPLKGAMPVQVLGNFNVKNSDIDFGKGAPLLRNTNGVLVFTEAGIEASGVSAEILGGKASINVQTAAEGTVHVSAKGRCDLDEVRKKETHPLLDYLHGGADWYAGISVAKKNVTVAIHSDLRGIGSELPQPFAKRAAKRMPLHVEQKSIAEGRDLITAQIGSLLDARLERHEVNGMMLVKRGTVNFGGQGKSAGNSEATKRPSRRSGVWLAGKLQELSIEGWGGLFGGAAEPGLAIPVAGASLRIGKLSGYGQIVTSLRVNAARRGDGLAARLSSNALNGEMTWLPRGYRNGAKLSAQLRNLSVAEDERTVQISSPVKTDSSGPSKNGLLRPGKVPALDIRIDDLQIKERQFGRIELVGHPEGKDWRLRRLNIANPDGSLSGDGIWRSLQANTQSQLNLQLKLDDAGKTLGRYGYPGTVKGGSGKLAANLFWAGAPHEFRYASLNGTLTLDAGKGRFLKMDPGAGKLLSILSLQALPSHITLDFNDVFRKGFQFDKITGSAAIKGGVIDTQDFRIDGSSAKVTMHGSVNLNDETQELRIRVFPTIGDSVSLISAFTAGPAIGVGTLIVSKILGDPLDKLVSFEYNVTGTWSDPNVVKVIPPQAQPPFE